ncbi:MAG: alpha/beta hydrolase [Oscillospiraceae bacterium]|nr:alpha/beta hydrolase [Oscillospiraceae bacterium]
MDNLHLIPPHNMFEPQTFPDSTELPDGAKSVTWSDKPTEGMISLTPNIVYQSLNGEDQRLQIITPMAMFAMPGVPAPKYPLVVYVPGSAFRRQNVWMALPRMIEVAQRGYAVAIVEYRPTEIGGVFPAQREDAKSAIRFMIAHADEYGIDADRIAVWGDSSGGHTSVSIAVTAPELVKCCVDWFGPTDIALMNYYPSGMDHTAPYSPEGMLIGGKNVLENPELAQEVNPINYITPENPVPPMLIMHGSKDMLVPFNQSVRLYNKLKECGKDVQFFKLEGGGHGSGGFNSDEALNLVIEFFREKL